jgi:hypothetical protein
MKNGNQSINPINTNTLISQMGLTKREYFAAMAMQGLLSNTDVDTRKTDGLTRSCVILADALLSQLESLK